MIIKSFEISKINLKNTPYVLFYGKNEGLKKEAMSSLLKGKSNELVYEEKEILDNHDIFLEDLFTKSLFDENKSVIIKRASDKILKIFTYIDEKKLENVVIIINADNLEKKTKLRSFFEKKKNYICVPFYPDNEQTLTKIAYSFLKKRNINFSQSNLNLIINKSNGDREALFNELNKIELLSITKKGITREDVEKLTNLAENHSVNELIDNCLAKNKKKILKILNENNFNNDDSILILKTFLNKSKKILILCSEFKKNQNLNTTISSAKLPIFWKDKEITRKQILERTPESIKEIIYKLNDIELILKKNINNSINLITDFILEQTSS